MKAERRYSARYPIDIKVQILYHGRRFFAAQGRNLSHLGIYLDVRNVTLPTGTQVELEMECLGKEWLLEAVVVHRNRLGVGVMFREPQPELCQGLTRRDPMMPPPPVRQAPHPQLLRS